MPRARVRLATRGTSRAGRAAQRRALGQLRDLCVQDATRRRYVSAVRAFIAHLLLRSPVLPGTAAALDRALADFFEDLWDSGEPRGTAGDAMSGLALFVPRLRGALPTAHRYYGAWVRAELPARAPPLPELFAYALAREAVARGWGTRLFYSHSGSLLWLGPRSSSARSWGILLLTFVPGEVFGPSPSRRAARGGVCRRCCRCPTPGSLPTWERISPDVRRGIGCPTARRRSSVHGLRPSAVLAG